MMSKVTPYGADLGPVCFLSQPSSCLRDKISKQYSTVENSEVLQKYKGGGGGGGSTLTSSRKDLAELRGCIKYW